MNSNFQNERASLDPGPWLRQSLSPPRLQSNLVLLKAVFCEIDGRFGLAASIAWRTLRGSAKRPPLRGA